MHDEEEHASIVGLWKFEMLSKSTSTNINPMPDGTLIDFGTAAWHADGTELKHFSGTFTLTQYLATATPGHEFDQTTKLVNITGTIQATRITAD